MEINKWRVCITANSSKKKVTPVKEVSIVRKELDAAVLSKSLMCFITKEMRYDFQDVIFLIDSEVVLAMISKESYGFKTHAAIRVGEIQESTLTKQWFWIDGISNIVDWITRGRTPMELGLNSPWQNGHTFMKLGRGEWPIRQGVRVGIIPEEIGKVCVIEAKTVSTISNLGVASTVSKIRLPFWIINIHKMVKSIVYQCITCRKIEKSYYCNECLLFLWNDSCQHRHGTQ